MIQKKNAYPTYLQHLVSSIVHIQYTYNLQIMHTFSKSLYLITLLLYHSSGYLKYFTPQIYSLQKNNIIDQQIAHSLGYRNEIQ